MDPQIKSLIDSVFTEREGSEMMRAFELLDVGTARIHLAEMRMRRKLTSDEFMLCRPPDAFAKLDDRMYTQHVDELLERFSRNESAEPATLAEVLIMMRNTSLAAPLNTDGLAVYVHCFRAVFGDAMTSKILGDLPVREKYPGAFEEMLAEARRKIPTGRAKKKNPARGVVKSQGELF